MVEIDLVALHEAAHCLALLSLNLRFTSVRLYHDDGEPVGVVELPSRRSEHGKQFDQAVVSLAGPLAELRVTGQVQAKAWLPDTRNACRNLRRSEVDQAIAISNDIVRDRWDEICLLAALLQQAGTLTYDQVKRLVAGMRNLRKSKRLCNNPSGGAIRRPSID